MEIKIDNSAQDYLKSLKYMENRVNEIIKNQNDELVWLLSHPAIYTSGSTDHKSDLLNNNKIPVIKTNRGGKYTYHGPGQRVVYLMINLNNRKKDIKFFVNQLEKLIIEILSNFHIVAEAIPDHHGVFVKKDNGQLYKIASIGLKVKKWVTYHGFSINVNNNLEDYKKIIPCGLDNNKITSIKNEGNKYKNINVNLKKIIGKYLSKI